MFFIQELKKYINYLDNNYKFYQKIKSPITIACYKKMKENDRE